MRSTPAAPRWRHGCAIPWRPPPSGFEPASEDASFRRYFRVHAGARTWVAMDAPPPMEDCRPFVSVLGLLRGAGVRAPALHAADVEHGFLLLDDLGSRCYLDVIGKANADALYTDAFAALLDMQCRIGPGQVPPYDDRKLREEMELFGNGFSRAISESRSTARSRSPSTRRSRSWCGSAWSSRASSSTVTTTRATSCISTITIPA